MTVPSRALGGRLPLADPESLTGAQRELFDAVTSTQVPWANNAGFQAATADGRLIGPFNTFLLQPEVASRFLEFSAAEATHTSLSERVREVVIIAVGAAWRADYELYAHSTLARKAGLSADSVTTLANGELPDDLSKHEKIAARVARKLSITRRIDDELYRAAEQGLRQKGLVRHRPRNPTPRRRPHGTVAFSLTQTRKATSGSQPQRNAQEGERQ
jgi:4-carboxymuconolactone decarboxylase